MKEEKKEAFAPLVIDGVPIPFQPHEFTKMTHAEYLTWAKEQERAGKRLVVETLVNAYPEDVDTWHVDHFVYTDFDTEEICGTREPGTAEAPEWMLNLLVVERRLANV